MIVRSQHSQNTDIEHGECQPHYGWMLNGRMLQVTPNRRPAVQQFDRAAQQ